MDTNRPRDLPLVASLEEHEQDRLSVDRPPVLAEPTARSCRRGSSRRSRRRLVLSSKQTTRRLPAAILDRCAKPPRAFRNVSCSPSSACYPLSRSNSFRRAMLRTTAHEQLRRTKPEKGYSRWPTWLFMKLLSGPVVMANCPPARRVYRCARLRYFCTAPLNASAWPSSPTILTAKLVGGDWQRDGIGAQKWRSAPIRKRHVTVASRIGTDTPPHLGCIIKNPTAPASL